MFKKTLPPKAKLFKKISIIGEASPSNVLSALAVAKAASKKAVAEQEASTFHHKIIECAGYFGHPTKKYSDGICFGLTMRWIEAALLDEVEVFQRRAKNIVELHDDLSGLENPDSYLDEYKRMYPEKYLGMRAFYDSLFLYQDPEGHKALFSQHVDQSDVENISQIASSHLIEEKGGLKAHQPLRYDTFSKNEEDKAFFLSYCQGLADKIDQSGYTKRVVFDLNCSSEGDQKHTASVMYNPKTHKWTGMDVNYFSPNHPEQSLEDFYDRMKRYMGFFSMRVISTKDEILLPELNDPSKIFGANIDTSKTLKHLLKLASKHQHVEVLQALLEKGADPNQIMSGVTCLLIAACKGHIQVVQALLKGEAKPNQANHDGWTPLLIASENGYVEVVQALLKGEAKPNQANHDGWTPLLRASKNGHIEVVQALLEMEADLNQANHDGWTPLLVASQNGHIKVVQALLEGGAKPNQPDKGGNTPLLMASQNGHVEVVQALLEKGADPNQANHAGWAPLLIAAQNDHLGVVCALLEKGADLNQADEAGCTPLFSASANGHIKVVQALLKGGANPNQANHDGWTPLLIASANGHIEVVQALLEKGADPNQANHAGWAPLLVASTNGHIEVVQALLEMGADLNQANHGGWTPLLAASNNGHIEVVKLLQAAIQQKSDRKSRFR